MDSINLLTMILTIVLTIMLVLLAILGIMYMSSKKKKKPNTSAEQNSTDNAKTNKKIKTYKLESVMDFMEFDTIVDNMISQKDGKRYIMVVECQGINYDLMSEVEKNSVEAGFIQFLNKIRHPIQIYTQTRTVNLESSLQTYKARVKEIENEFQKQQIQYNQMLRSENYTQEQLNQALFFFF